MLPTLYRSLLRLGKQLDAAPLAKALLIAQPELLFDRRSRELIRLPALNGSAGQELSRRLAEFNGGEFYAPETSALAAVRRARETPSAVDPVDAGFSALRTLSAAHNRLSTAPVVALSRLVPLNLCGNQLSEIPTHSACTLLYTVELISYFIVRGYDRLLGGAPF